MVQSNVLRSLLFFVITFMLAVTAYAGLAVSLPQTGQAKCYDTAGTEIVCTGTVQDEKTREALHTINSGYPLPAGWNSISFSKQPPDTAIEKAFGTILSKVRIVWGYDSQAKQWLRFKPSGSGNTLPAIASGQGYWIYMNEEGVLDVSAWNPPSVSSIHLYDGWNLIGYLWTGGKNVPGALQNIPGKWKVLWAWESGQWKLAKAPDVNGQFFVPELTDLDEGKAYWLYINPGQGGFPWEPDYIKPTVTSVSPASGATNIAINTSSITATFSESIDASSIYGSKQFWRFRLRHGNLQCKDGNFCPFR